MESLASFIESPAVATFVNAHDWVWPLCEILHFTGMALLIGTVGLLDARILGMGKGVSIASLEKLVPFAVVGFALNVATGYIFVAGNPIGGSLDYVTNLAFQIKMLLIAIAGINVLVFYFLGVSRATETVGADGDAALNARIIAAASLVLWFGVIVFGRLIMYNDTLLYALGL